MNELVWVGVGQAGLTLGSRVWDLGGEVLPVLVDSEPKVTRQILRGHTHGPRRSPSTVVGQSGSGGNFALGFNGHGAMVQQAVEAVRREAERCSIFEGVGIIHSVAGGTGSGLGARLLRELRDAYPQHYLLCASVAPFRSGDSPLKHYNASLCLSALQELADAVVLLDNNDVLSALERGGAGPRVGLDDINGFMAGSLRGCMEGIPPGQLCEAIAPMPSAKFCEAWAESARSSSGRTWESLAQGLSRSVAPSRSRALLELLVARGPPIDLLDEDDSDVGGLNAAKRIVAQRLPQPSWVPETQRPRAVKIATDAKKMSLGLALNRSPEFLRRTATRAEEMLEAGAYLHWYERHGITAAEVRESIDTLLDVSHGYDALAG